MTRLNIWKCDGCGHIFNPREARWGIGGTSTGRQLCSQCAKPYNARAAFLRAMTGHTYV